MFFFMGIHIHNLNFFSKGPNISQLERELGAGQFAINEHFIGLVNVSIFLFFVFQIFSNNSFNFSTNYFLVWQYMLLQLCVASTVLLQALS